MGALALPTIRAVHVTPTLNSRASPPFAHLFAAATSLLAAVALASCHMSMTVEEPTLAPLDPSAVRIDLDVDTDRDGVVDNDLDEAGEDAWTPGRGAIFMVNLAVLHLSNVMNIEKGVSITSYVSTGDAAAALRVCEAEDSGRLPVGNLTTCPGARMMNWDKEDRNDHGC